MNPRKEDGIKGRAILLGLLAALGLAATPARAGSFTRIVSFGDSLSDVGNVFAATGGTTPDPANYHQGRYSNGPVWVEYLAGKLGVATPTPSLLGGTDYAFGGAESSPSGDSTLGSPNLGTQVGMYLGTSPTIGADTLLTIWAGANDFLQGGQFNPAVVVGNVVQAITTLAGAGGSEFLVANLPMLGEIPDVSGAPDFIRDGLNTLSSSFNAQLKIEVGALEQSLGITIHYLDIGQYFQEMIADPAAFGLTNVTDPMMGTGNTSGYLFWDGVHPTTEVYALVAALAFKAVVPEPSSIALLSVASVGLTAAAAFHRRRAA